MNILNLHLVLKVNSKILVEKFNKLQIKNITHVLSDTPPIFLLGQTMWKENTWCAL